jgi:hypothetical protein
MELRTKSVAIALIVVLLGSLAVGVAIARNNSKTPAAVTTAPLSAAYVQYQQNKSAGKVTMHTPDGQPLGYVPPPKYIQKRATPAVVQAVQEPR